VRRHLQKLLHAIIAWGWIDSITALDLTANRERARVERRLILVTLALS
jgi:hypothetical protein